MSKFTQLIVGVAEVAAGAIMAATGVGAAIAPYLIMAGGGTILSGIGTILTARKPTDGYATTTRNPVAPWKRIYGRTRVGGTVVYRNEWPKPGQGAGGNDQIMDLVVVIASHPCQSIDAVLFDMQRVQIDATSGTCNTSGTSVTWVSGSQKFTGGGWRSGAKTLINGQVYTIASIAGGGGSLTLTSSAGTQTGASYVGGGSSAAGAYPGSGVSFTPKQQSIGPGTGGIPKIQRANGVVTVTLNANIPYLIEGDKIQVQNVTTDPSLNGTFTVAQIISQVFGSPGSIIFTYLNGGLDVTITGQGQVNTLWADYGRKVYFEPLMGQQTLGETFAGMIAGTPLDGDMNGFVRPEHTGGVEGANAPNPWTANCSLQGKTAVFLRLRYDPGYFKGGLPQISFLVHGKNDILDPRPSPMTNGYSENAALCIADYLATVRTAGGFGYQYGTEIPYPQLIAAANTCDEPVDLAYSPASPPLTEPAYTCNGHFDLNMRRGEILKNLLTSCAGRITNFGGKVVIWPAAWHGIDFAIGSDPGGGVVALGDLLAIAAGSIRWRPKPSIRDLYNGVKGTYISKADKFQSTDFPPYAQDALHGYSGPVAFEGDANLAADGGERRWLEISLPFTISAAAAQRIAKIELLRRRPLGNPVGTGTLALNMAAFQVTPCDVIEATVPQLLAWGSSPGSPKLLEVVEKRLLVEKNGEDEAPSLRVELDIQETDSSVFEWSPTEELSPQGYQQPILPGIGLVDFLATETVPGYSAPYPWCPGQEMPLVGDALYPGPKLGSPQYDGGRASFGMKVQYGRDAMGNAVANLNITGVAPPSDLSSISPPQVSVTAGTSGQLPPGTYVVVVSAIDTGTPVRNSVLSTPALITIPPPSPLANTGSISVAIDWSFGANGGEVYLGLLDPVLPAGKKAGATGLYFQAALSAGTTSFEIDAFDQSGPGAPDATFDHLAVAWKMIVHSGVWAQQVQAVTATTITIAGSGMTTNEWAGRALTLLGKLDSTQGLKILNMPVASSTASSGGFFTLTIGPNANGDRLPDLTTLLSIGDLLVMRFDATFGPQSFSDAQIANPYYPSGATSVEAGHVAVVLTGPDAGDVQTIASVSLDGFGHATIFELAAPWAVQPNNGDIVIIVAPDYGPEVKTHPLPAPSRDAVAGVLANPLVTNLAGQPWLFLVRAENAKNVNGPDSFAPMREIYIFGSQGTRTIFGASPAPTIDQVITDRLVNCDASAGPLTYQLLPFADIPNQSMFIQKIDSTANPVTILCDGPSGDEITWKGTAVTSVVLDEDGENLAFIVSGNG